MGSVPGTRLCARSFPSPRRRTARSFTGSSGHPLSGVQSSLSSRQLRCHSAVGRAGLHGSRSRSAVLTPYYLFDARRRGGPGDLPYPPSGAISALSRFGRTQSGTGLGAHIGAASARLSESRDTGTLREVSYPEDVRKPRSTSRRGFRQIGLGGRTPNLPIISLIPRANSVTTKLALEREGE